jgi:hypothetical protein
MRAQKLVVTNCEPTFLARVAASCPTVSDLTANSEDSLLASRLVAGRDFFWAALLGPPLISLSPLLCGSFFFVFFFFSGAYRPRAGINREKGR